MMNEMEKRIEAFDTEVEDLSNLKLRVNVEAKFLELHLLTLQQELTVLKDFEDVDEEVSNKVLNSLQDKHDMERKVWLILLLRILWPVPTCKFRFQSPTAPHPEAVSAFIAITMKMAAAMYAKTMKQHLHVVKLNSKYQNYTGVSYIQSSLFASRIECNSKGWQP
jgi:hypothetical protein